MTNLKWMSLGAAAIALLIISGGCGSGASGSSASGSTGSGAPAVAVKGAVRIDGSSTVSPIMQAVAEEFVKNNPDSEPTVAQSGTGGGFKKFIAGEIDIAMASRPIEGEEVESLKKAGIEFIELPIAFDGLSVVVHKDNNWAESLTVAELKKMWEKDSKVDNWKDVRAGFPDQALKLYGAGTDSGTFDYFTEAINGESKSSRTDYQGSEDDNQLVQGVAGDKGALGYFGYAYYIQNQDKLKIVKIDGGKGPVEPSPETISGGTYQPLSRPLLIYINKKALEEKPAVKALVEFLLNDSEALITDSGYIPLPKEIIDVVKKHLEEKKVGTVFQGAEVGIGIKEILAREAK